MKPLALPFFLLAAACAQTQYQVPAPMPGQAPTGATQAFFAEFPIVLFASAEESCSAPGQTLVRPRPDAVLCTSLPEPEAAAALILQFDGTVDKLPSYVISFSSLNVTDGFVVTADAYIRVPQRAGGVRQVRFEDLQLSDDLAELLKAAGGTDLPTG